ncbi:hypothetical protein G9A89_018594 [Geosiphon pyriformis]|nr:hypothetical protein G9A89_018594 [Geosiphon pyriformis]
MAEQYEKAIAANNTTSNNLEAKQKQPPTNNILLATITEDELLTAIFSFELKEPIETLLFSRATLESKLIMTIYTDAKVDGQLIKLILDSKSVGSIITQQLMNQLDCQTTKTSIGEIDNFPFEISGIVMPIKVLIIKATQYQALVNNDWLFKTNAVLN